LSKGNKLMSFASVLARMKNRGLFLAILFLLPLLRGQNSASVPPFRDPDLSPEEPAADLVGSLTLQEKVLPMRNSVPAIVPLDIPAYDWWNEAGAAWWARAGGATVFPQAIGLAATWDADLVHRVSDVISTIHGAECRHFSRPASNACADGFRLAFCCA
jgi:beta-glucosidase